MSEAAQQINPQQLREAHAIMAEEMIQIYRAPEADERQKITALGNYLLVCAMLGPTGNEGRAAFEQGLLAAGGEPEGVAETASRVFNGSDPSVREFTRAIFTDLVTLPDESLKLKTKNHTNFDKQGFIDRVLALRRDPAA